MRFADLKESLKLCKHMEQNYKKVTYPTSSHYVSKQEKLHLNNVLVAAIYFTKIHSCTCLLLFMLSLIVVQIILHISISVPFSALAPIGQTPQELVLAFKKKA